jgi:hypothetical protein
MKSRIRDALPLAAVAAMAVPAARAQLFDPEFVRSSTKRAGAHRNAPAAVELFAPKFVKCAGAQRNAPAAVHLLGAVVGGLAAWLGLEILHSKWQKGVVARNSVVLEGRVLNSTRPGEADVSCLIDTGALHFHVVIALVSPTGTSSSTGKHP